MSLLTVSKSGIAGKGVYATRAIPAGAYVVHMRGRRVSGATLRRLHAGGKLRWDDPLEIGIDQYILLSGTPLFINHSCDPSCGIRGLNGLYALRDIQAGDEITFDYSTVVGMNAPDETDWYMRCRCGSSLCRKRIGNWQTLPKDRLEYYLQHKALPRFVMKQVLAYTER